MSCNVGDFIACPAVQKVINGEFGTITGRQREPSPFTEFIVSDQNTQGILQREVSPGSGKLRSVTLTYESRFTEDQVSDDASIDCTGGDKPGETSETYSIDPSVGSKFKWSVDLSDLATRCEADSAYMARQVQKAIDVVVRDINTKNIEAAASLVGNFASTGSDAAITVKTKNTDGVYIAEAMEKVRFQMLQNEYYGSVALFGGSELFSLYFSAMNAACCNSTYGLDLNAMFAQKNLVPFFDRKVDTLLGTNEFFALVPGALQMLTYNRYNGEKGIRVINQDTEKAGTIIDPMTGLEFDYKAQYVCETWNFTVSLAHKLVGAPTDLYCANDRLTGYTGVNQFVINNA